MQTHIGNSRQIYKRGTLQPPLSIGSAAGKVREFSRGQIDNEICGVSGLPFTRKKINQDDGISILQCGKCNVLCYELFYGIVNNNYWVYNVQWREIKVFTCDICLE